MVGVIIISESKAAVEQLRTVKRVLGKRTLPHIEPVVIKSDFSARTLKSKINTAINKVKSPDGVLILTELYGTTQCNVCLDFIHTDQVELISGYNLPIRKAKSIRVSLEPSPGQTLVAGVDEVILNANQDFAQQAYRGDTNNQNQMAETDTQDDGDQDVSVTQTAAQTDVKSRLLKLEQLKKEKLITATEYNQKRQEILSEL